MRVTQTLYSGLRDVSVRRWNKLWECRGRFYDYPAKIPQALLDRGVEVVEMNQVKPELPRWTPPVPDDPRFMEPLPPHEQPDWKDEPAFTYDRNIRLFEGMKQACLLAKAQHFEGLLPPSVEKLVGAVDIEDRDLLLQRYIMQSQVWNTCEDKLPKRFDRRKPGWKFQREFGIKPSHSSHILLRNLLRLSQSQVTKFESLGNRRQIADALLHSYVIYRDQPIVAKHPINFLVTSDTALAPFGDESTVDASVGHSVPDMWPVYPTVDFVPTNNYELCSLPGLSQGGRQSGQTPLCPHTLLEICSVAHWNDGHIHSKQLLSCLMATAALARRKYGADVRVLPEPISLQHIAIRETRLLFTFFQLNTLDLDSGTGVKNLVWTGKAGNLCEKHLGQPWMPRPLQQMRLESFDGAAYDSFLAAYLNGIPELTMGTSTPSS